MDHQFSAIRVEFSQHACFVEYLLWWRRRSLNWMCRIFQKISQNHQANQHQPKKVNWLKMRLHGDGQHPSAWIAQINLKIHQKYVISHKSSAHHQSESIIYWYIYSDSTEVPEKESPSALDSEVILRRTRSFENDEKWVVRSHLRATMLNLCDWPVWCLVNGGNDQNQFLSLNQIVNNIAYYDLYYAFIDSMTIIFKQILLQRFISMTETIFSILFYFFYCFLSSLLIYFFCW